INEEGGYSAFETYRNTFNYFGNNNPFAVGQLGATPWENWMYNVIASTSPAVRVTAVPFTDKKGNVIDYETGSAWVIPKAAKNKAAACEFAKTMVDTQTWLAAAKNRIAIYKKKGFIFTGLLTGNHVADTAILKLYLSQQPKNGAFVQATRETYSVENGSFTVPASPASEEVQTAWTNAVNAVLQGQMKPKQALDQAQSQAQSAIDQASQ
ncbi:MAG: sugar transporter periplasmic protein, partial [Acidimicrobiaceae bacterium]|nr:sugar transporter periplasmic protein [Acidimicrobiaceae bacterium]